MDPRLFCFFISGEETRIFPGSRLYNLPLSGESTGLSADISCESNPLEPILTVGDYFSAAGQFLLKNDFSILKSGLEIVCQPPVQTDQISQISFFLEKHGAFYHPLKIQVVTNDGRICSFVLNGAVSNQGLSLIKSECHLISSLNKAFLKRQLPRVFGSDFIQTDKGRIGFFLGEWFEGYKEFHVSFQKGKKQTVVWESDGSCHHIPETEALKIYEEIARILTYYYDIETFNRISPWHHAAGDFIVRQGSGSLHVRLITARGYSPLTQFYSGEGDKEIYILPSLLFFFLDLSVRMRIDRIDGTGKIMMLGKQVVTAAVKGFLTALDEKSTAYDFGDVRSVFLEFSRQFNPKQMTEMMENIVEFYPSSSSEMALIRGNLNSHCRTLHTILRNI